MRFGPDDEEAFYEARDELADRFESSVEGDGLGWVATQVLDFKWGYLDGDLTRWHNKDVEEILLGLYPAKVMVDPGDVDLIVAGFSGFLLFLGDEGLVERDHSAHLAATVRHLADEFRVAALDERNWATGKRLWSRAEAEGADFSDADAVQRFMDDFNRRSFADRGAILGFEEPGAPPSRLADLAATVIGPLPPITLPPNEELEAAARATVGFERLRRLVEFVGEGRPLTQKGNLKLADGKLLVELLETGDRFDPVYGGEVFRTRSTADLAGVDLAFRIALESGTLSIEATKVVRGPNAGLIDEPLSALYGAWLTLVHAIGPTRHRARGDRYGFDWYAEELDRELSPILIELYRDGALPIDGIADDLWTHLLMVFDLDHVAEDKLSLHREFVGDSLRSAFDRFVDMGMVHVEGVTETTNRFGRVERSGGTVDLTPLGKWAVQRLASRFTSAPVVGALRELTAAELLVAASDIPEAEANAEIDAWVDHHGLTACADLVEAIRGADETGRGLGFRALLRVGPAAADAVMRLADEPELAPFATVWRVDTLTASGEEVDCGGDPERFVRLLGAVIELWSPEAAVAGWAGPCAGNAGLAAMIERAWRVKLPVTEQVLAAIGGSHDDKTISKAARKALFKHRTAG